MAVSIRTRFEVFKRDSFTCRYCGQQSPTVVLEVDHIVPTCEGGSDDTINLTTSCWNCNRGKAGVPLNEILVAEDPHDKAIAIIETERQLREYNAVLLEARNRREVDAWELLGYWKGNPKIQDFDRGEFTWLVRTLGWLPAETIRDFMDSAFRADAIRDLRYVKACVRSLREHQEAKVG